MRSSFCDEIHLLHSRLCAGLADPKRILILYLLSERPRNVTNLADTLGLSQPTVSRHLRNLRERKLVLASRDGQSVYYSISDRRVIQALDLLRGVLAEQLSTQASLAESASESMTPESSE